mgnify:CR=1 FL=1
MEATLYRPNAGIIIFNKKGKLLWCKRRTGDGWQFPQGGIDEGESTEEALFRELHEETGLIKSKVSILAVSSKWLVYHIPHVFQRSNKKYDGAMQKWYLLQLTGTNNDINLNAVNHAEFDAWKWANKETAINNVIRFKKSVYESILAEFSDVLETVSYTHLTLPTKA